MARCVSKSTATYQSRYGNGNELCEVNMGNRTKKNDPMLGKMLRDELAGKFEYRVILGNGTTTHDDKTKEAIETVRQYLNERKHGNNKK
jgi:hypothetical protein